MYQETNKGSFWGGMDPNTSPRTGYPYERIQVELPRDEEGRNLLMKHVFSDDYNLYSPKFETIAVWKKEEVAHSLIYVMFSLSMNCWDYPAEPGMSAYNYSYIRILENPIYEMSIEEQLKGAILHTTQLKCGGLWAADNLPPYENTWNRNQGYTWTDEAVLTINNRSRVDFIWRPYFFNNANFDLTNWSVVAIDITDSFGGA